MSTQEYGVVSGSTSLIHNEPHIRGSRITIRDIRQRVEVRGDAPVRVAERFDLDVADVYAALAYYHANPGEMRELEKRHAAAIREARERSGVIPSD